MRRIPALLCAAGLATAPASVVAGPSKDPGPPPRSQTIEKLEWSTAKGRLGVMVMSLTPELRKHFGASPDRGVIVAHVDPGTPAEAAGIQVGDVIVEVRDQKIDAAPDVLSALAPVGKGERARIELVRDGRSRTLEATLADDALAGTMASPLWPRSWMKPLDALGAPFDEPPWLRDGPKSLDQAQRGTGPAEASSWLDKLRELFATKHDPVCKRS